MVETPERSYMLGAIIGDIAGSIYEFDNIKRRDFEFLSERCEPTDDSILTCAIARALIDVKGRGDTAKTSDYISHERIFSCQSFANGGIWSEVLSMGFVGCNRTLW